MKNFFSYFFILVFLDFGYSQSLDSLQVSRINDTIISKYLNEKRSIEVQLPRSYDFESKKKYPLIIVLDGDYMFNIVSGSVDYLSYWNDIPENLVVGINQKDSRFKDSSVLDNITNTPITSTASFFDFVVNELIPYISRSYRVSDFKVIIGQERTANFINFFLLKQKPIIRGYISISPRLSENMDIYLSEYLSKTKTKIIYTISSSKKDFESIYNNVTKLSKSLDSINNENLKFNSLILEDENHYIIPSLSIPNSIRKTYSLYSDIDKVEYDSIISKLDSSPIDYLNNKYRLIKELYDIEKTISINDFMAIEEYIEENEYFEFYDNLSKLAFKEYPDTILSSYYKGRFFEENGNPEKAMHIYRSAYNMNEVEGLTKDYLLELADRIQEDFNY
ncbi:MAG: esterase [Rickettsiales bacterium]|nr:esterase [Rickettsiales bacterium]|tara:strand:- start:717 stop:1892 length:1176 start_codon:yes stop_codon:yes gene_type:complete